MTAPTAGLVVISLDELKEVIRELLDEHEAERREVTPPAPPEPDYVDAHEMCRRIGVSRSTLHRLRVAGMPGVIRMGDTYRYKPSVVISHLEARRK